LGQILTVVCPYSDGRRKRRSKEKGLKGRLKEDFAPSLEVLAITLTPSDSKTMKKGGGSMARPLRKRRESWTSVILMIKKLDGVPFPSKWLSERP